MPDVLIDEFVVFSDHHANAFTYGAEAELYDNCYHNSRLLASVRVLDQITDYCEQHKLSKVFFVGDLFHTRESVSTDALVLTHAAIRRMARTARVVMIPGNHDYFDRDGKIHSMQLFATDKNIQVIDWSKILRGTYFSGERGDIWYAHCVPYTERLDQAKAALKKPDHTEPATPAVLFAHLGMQGAVVGSDYVLVSPNDVGVADVPQDDYAGCFFGHFHRHQQLFKNGWYVGASHAHNWGDANEKRGFLHVRLYQDHVEFDFIESNAPRFLALYEDAVQSAEIRATDFVTIYTNKTMDDEGKARVRDTVKAGKVEVVHVPDNIKLQDIELDETHLTPSVMVETWVKANEDWLKANMPDVEHEDLIQYGRAMLAKAMEAS